MVGQQGKHKRVTDDNALVEMSAYVKKSTRDMANVIARRTKCKLGDVLEPLIIKAYAEWSKKEAARFN